MAVIILEWLCIGIKLVHLTKFFCTNANNNYWKRKIRGFYNFVYCGVIIIYGTISQNQQNVVFLILLWFFHWFLSAVSTNLLENFSEPCRAKELAFCNTVLICCDNSFNSDYLRIEYISICCKAMTGTPLHKWKLSSKIVNRKLLVGIIFLDDCSNWSNCMNICVSCFI